MHNLGLVDRVIRAIAGLSLIIAPLLFGWPMPWLIVNMVAGAILVAPSSFGFCPVYALLGSSSKRRGLV